jgi:hypothetical protein
LGRRGVFPPETRGPRKIKKEQEKREESGRGRRKMPGKVEKFDRWLK